VTDYTASSSQYLGLFAVISYIVSWPVHTGDHIVADFGDDFGDSVDRA